MADSEVVTNEEGVATAGSQQMKGKPLVLLQVNCRRILNKILEFWNLVDSYNPDVIISTESWLERKLTMLKYLGTITRPSREIGVF
jgi:hypothetical protein